VRGTGRVIFVAVLLLLAGTLDIIYGIAAVSNAHFFDHTQYAFSNLHTWGWITIIVGIIQLTAGFSLFGSGTYGRVIGINQQIESQSGGGEGVGFAVPVDVVKHSLDQLRDGGQAHYAYLGVVSVELYPQLVQRVGGLAAMLVASALLAGYLPARRAASIDPTVALRGE